MSNMNDMLEISAAVTVGLVCLGGASLAIWSIVDTRRRKAKAKTTGEVSGAIHRPYVSTNRQVSASLDRQRSRREKYLDDLESHDSDSLVEMTSDVVELCNRRVEPEPEDRKPFSLSGFAHGSSRCESSREPACGGRDTVDSGSSESSCSSPSD